jgi:hypothetical protein
MIGTICLLWPSNINISILRGERGYDSSHVSYLRQYSDEQTRPCLGTTVVAEARSIVLLAYSARLHAPARSSESSHRDLRNGFWRVRRCTVLERWGAWGGAHPPLVFSRVC